MKKKNERDYFFLVITAENFDLRDSVLIHNGLEDAPDESEDLGIANHKNPFHRLGIVGLSSHKQQQRNKKIKKK